MNMKNSMVDPHGGLIGYLDEDLEDEDDKNSHTAAAERIKQQVNSEYNALLQVSNLPVATNIPKWHASRGLTILGKVVLDYLAIPASSLPLKQATSIVAGIWDNILRLSNKIFHAEICIRLWMKLFSTLGINYQTISKKSSTVWIMKLCLEQRMMITSQIQSLNI